MIEGKEPMEEIVVGPAAIHLTLGLVRYLLPNCKHCEVGLKADCGKDKKHDFQKSKY